MQITVNREKLNNALRILERIISKNVSLPILSTVKLKTEKNNVKISATNLELGINCWLGAKIAKDGEVAVPARLFSGLVSNIKDEKISLVTDGNTLKIDSEDYKTKLLGYSTEDFPIIPKIKKENEVSFNPQELKQSLASVIDSVLPSDTRPELAGVFINVGDKKIEFASTDSFRLSEKIVDNIEGGSYKGSLILPRQTAVELMRIAETYNGKINIVIAENQIMAYGNDFELVSRLVDGRYPDYKKIIPDKIVSLLRLKKGDFERSIRTAGFFSSSIYDIKLKVTNNKTEIIAQNNDKGNMVASLSSELKNNPFEVTVNYNYLLDGLKNISTENVIIKHTGDGSPLLMVPDKEDGFLYLIMPLRS
ncbi:MAG: DNA polymerase III subunit beta [Candidatus Yanofskybacteria bacterium CG10_big_fil_rev_8_21_14_0_10_36_16]|uniref:Beta sliding clamp n=1 Tax=Candidatus Yanofskybacteria bacterium CG10_big_fil_rev_8_21_14_0_10_36_16 TaxID=1975096 RepID=A0A2J0Q6G3_9BACT|nr:MAG: DNA polymerase III subunit beta [Candidatus Yanofskybacteria bacterium CG10_big_fil_rev_8_21_14_0_10_36_16]